MMTRACQGARAYRVCYRAGLLALVTLVAVPAAFAQDAAAWLARAAAAAQKQNYIGTIVYQHGGRVETSRLVHLNEQGSEFEKLVNLEGPAREVIRMNGEVRCYYPDAKVVRVEPRTFRNAFPSLSPQQQAALTDFYTFRMAERGRVAGIETQAWVFEPKDGMRYGHKFWVDPVSGLLVKARIVDERDEVIEQFAFTEIAIGGKIERDAGESDVDRNAPGLAVAPIGAGRIGLEGHGLDRHARAAGVRQDRRWLPPPPQHAAGGASRLFGRPRGGVGVHRADRRRVASDRNRQTGRRQRRDPAAGR